MSDTDLNKTWEAVRRERDRMDDIVTESGLAGTLATLALVCHERSQRAPMTNMVNAWGRCAEMISTLAASKSVSKVTP